MRLAHLLVRIYVLFMAVFGFLFSQLFFGDFDLRFTLVGLSGVVAGSLAGRKYSQSKRVNFLVIASCILGLIGVAMDAISYYANPQVSGDGYAWFLNGAFCLGLSLLGLGAWKTLPSPIVASPIR